MSVINIKFTKFDNTPWGFRLVGGNDFPQPLTVIKVAEGSLAECMGLKPGDVVTSLNDRPVSSLTHGQAHEALMLAGNNFVLRVLRPWDSLQAIEEIQADNAMPYTIDLQQLPPIFPEEILSMKIEELSIEEQVIPETVEEDQPPSPGKPTDDNSDIVPNKNLTDEEIAQLILEEEELLIPDQGVLGVNFNKIRPRLQKLKESKVLEELQKIAVEEPPRIQELKHTSTFLQKPQRPPPPSKGDLEKQASADGEQYQVLIKKQQKKSVTERLLEKGLLEPREEQISKSPIEITEPTATPEPYLLSRQEAEPRSEIGTEETELDLTAQKKLCEDGVQMESTGRSDQHCAQVPTEEINEETLEISDNSEQTSENLPVSNLRTDNVEELVSMGISLEEQLECVQNQLLALKQLPIEIENKLRIVSEQLHKIMDIRNLRNENERGGRQESADSENGSVEPSTNSSRVLPHEQPDDTDDYRRSPEPVLTELPKTMVPPELPIITEPELEEGGVESDPQELGEMNVKSMTEDSRVKRCIASYQIKVLKSREPSPTPSHGSYKPDHDVSSSDQVMQEVKERGGKKGAGECWPQAKQIELTYGRRWRCPNDFFNDELIAEVLSSQAEVIRGRAMGVNFKKFEKNWLPNYDHLMGSSVYKMLHKMEREPKTGIPVRPPKVNAAEDIIKRISSPPSSVVDDNNFRSISH